MPTREQKLEQELAAIKKDKQEKAKREHEAFQASAAKERRIKLADGEYRLTINNYSQSDFPPDKVEKALASHGLFVRHEFNGNVRDAFTGTVSKFNLPKAAFEPIDKGRPSTVFCDNNGKALFSFAVYEDNELAVYPIGEIHGW